TRHGGIGADQPRAAVGQGLAPADAAGGRIVGGVFVGAGLGAAPAQCVEIDARLVVFTLCHRGVVGLVGDDHGVRERAGGRAGGRVRTATVAISSMREVIEASPAIRVKDSRLSSQKRDLPPKPRSLIIDKAKSKPYFSARSTTSRLRSKLGVYCGDVDEISQPLLPMGIKTPISILHRVI